MIFLTALHNWCLGYALHCDEQVTAVFQHAPFAAKAFIGFGTLRYNHLSLAAMLLRRTLRSTRLEWSNLAWEKGYEYINLLVFRQ